MPLPLKCPTLFARAEASVSVDLIRRRRLRNLIEPCFQARPIGLQLREECHEPNLGKFSIHILSLQVDANLFSLRERRVLN